MYSNLLSENLAKNRSLNLTLLVPQILQNEIVNPILLELKSNQDQIIYVELPKMLNMKIYTKSEPNIDLLTSFDDRYDDKEFDSLRNITSSCLQS